MSESALVTVLGRIQLLDPGDLGNIRSLQDQFAIMPLHWFLKTAEPRPVEYQLSFPEWDEKVISTPAFISYLNNYLQYTSVDPSEKALRISFEKIGIIPGAAYDSSIYTQEVLAAIRTGIADAQKDLEKLIEQTHSSTGLFGTREQMKNDYMKRAVGAAAGIYGNTAEEAVYLGMHQNENDESLNGKTPYVLRIKKGEFPPCKYFWSVTMYGLPERHLVKNEIERYSIGDRTTGLKYENNGDLLIYIQAAAPGKDKMSNWLPAPEGAYDLICRIYGPEQPVLDGSWKFPFPQKVK